MAIVKTDNKHYAAIAEKIREKSGKETQFLPAEMPSGIDEVYEAGKQAERDDFWSIFQNYGNPTSYAHAFSGNRFTDENYNPQYPINCISSVGISTSYVFSSSPITDTKVEIIIGQNRELTYFFSNCRNLHTIRKITLTGNNRFASAFSNCHALENITIEGVISNDINLNWSPLTVASMKSVILALENFTDTENAFAKTVKFSSECWAALDAEGATSPNGNTWKEYVREDLCWNI